MSVPRLCIPDRASVAVPGAPFAGTDHLNDRGLRKGGLLASQWRGLSYNQTEGCVSQSQARGQLGSDGEQHTHTGNSAPTKGPFEKPHDTWESIIT